jgi:hypothetical protein
MRNASDRCCRDNENTHLIFNKFFPKITVCERTWKNIVEPDRPMMAIRHVRIACWIPKATNTHSKYVILTAFSTITMVVRTRLNVTFIPTLPVFSVT